MSTCLYICIYTGFLISICKSSQFKIFFQELRLVGSIRVYMSTVYDNWERLTAAVIRREELWELFHAPSRTSSLSSIASDYSTSSRWGPSSPLEFSSYLPSVIKSVGYIRVDKGNSDLVYIENSVPAFDLQDLLEASWEFIGDDGLSFSSTFAATLSDGTTIVLKKLKIGRVANEVFDEKMAIVRSIDNENVASLRGCFFAEDGVWGLYDYFSQGSASVMLHGMLNPIYSPIFASFLTFNSISLLRIQETYLK